MSKRFTESDKWKDKWFRALSPGHKLAWLYLLDNCDQAGVIDIDCELANFQIGHDIDWEQFIASCGTSRISMLANGKLHIVRFVEYQYGKLSEQCRPHIPIMMKLREHGIEDVQQKETFKHGNVTSKRRLEVFERDGNVCCYCGGKFSNEELEPDHVIPKSAGGNDSKENLVAACRPCNAKKSDKSLSYFLSTLDDKKSVLKRLSQRVSERVFNTLEEKDKEQEQEKDKDKDKDKNKDKDKEEDKDSEEWIVPESLDCEQVRNLLDRFAAMRKKIKKPIKDFRNASVMLSRFDSSEHLAYALETCIANEYQGLKPDYRPPPNARTKGNSEYIFSKLGDAV